MAWKEAHPIVAYLATKIAQDVVDRSLHINFVMLEVDSRYKTIIESIVLKDFI